MKEGGGRKKEMKKEARGCEKKYFLVGRKTATWKVASF